MEPDARDRHDSQRAAAPLMIALGAKVINNSNLTPEQTSGQIIADIKVPFARPRDFSLGETEQFNELCSVLRREIEMARWGEDATRH